MFDVVLNDMFVVCRYVWDGVGRWKWAQVHCSPPLRVKREDGGWRDECVSGAAPGPRGCHVVHVTATVSQQQCVCTVWWGEVGRHEGLSLLHVLVALSGDTCYVLVNYTKYHEQTLIVMLAHTHTRTHAHTHTRTHAHTHSRTQARTHARTHTDTHTHTHTHDHLQWCHPPPDMIPHVFTH